MRVSNCTGARRSRSPISMSRMGMRWSPPRRSSRRRMIFRLNPPFSQSFINCRNREPGNVPAITRMSVALAPAATSPTSSSFPSTGIWPSRDFSVSSVQRKPRMR